MKTIMNTLNGHDEALVNMINDIYDELGEKPFLDYIDKSCPDWEEHGDWDEYPEREGNEEDYVHFFLENYCDDRDLNMVIKSVPEKKKFKVRITYTFSDTFEVEARSGGRAVDLALYEASAKDLDDFEEQDGESEIL